MVCKIKKEWIDIEMEHFKKDNPRTRAMAKKIVGDHLKEGCNYYPELIKMEKKLKR